MKKIKPDGNKVIYVGGIYEGLERLDPTVKNYPSYSLRRRLGSASVIPIGIEISSADSGIFRVAERVM